MSSVGWPRPIRVTLAAELGVGCLLVCYMPLASWTRASRAGPDPGRVRSSYPAQRVAKCSEERRNDSEQALGAPHLLSSPPRSARFYAAGAGPVSSARDEATGNLRRKGNDTISWASRNRRRKRGPSASATLEGEERAGDRRDRDRERSRRDRRSRSRDRGARTEGAARSKPRAAAPVAVRAAKARPHARAEHRRRRRGPRRRPLGRWRPLRRRGRPGELRRRRLRRPAAAATSSAVQRRLPRLHERQGLRGDNAATRTRASTRRPASRSATTTPCPNN